jgi:hypothetical protein
VAKWWARQDYLALRALDPFRAITQHCRVMFKFASCKFSRTCCMDVGNAGACREHEAAGQVANPAAKWWARQDSNLQPRDYESPALTVVLQAHLRIEF